jgi:hypothetical protein
VEAEYRAGLLFVFSGFIFGVFNDAFLFKIKGTVVPSHNSGQRHEHA